MRELVGGLGGGTIGSFTGALCSGAIMLYSFKFTAPPPPPPPPGPHRESMCGAVGGGLFSEQCNSNGTRLQKQQHRAAAAAAHPPCSTRNEHQSKGAFWADAQAAKCCTWEATQLKSNLFLDRDGGGYSRHQTRVAGGERGNVSTGTI